MKRIVVKVGTKILSREDKTLDEDFIADLVEQIVQLRKRKIQVILVTSGAVGAGRSLLTGQNTVSETVQKQIFAAVGQVKLMDVYSKLFEKHGYHCAQVLATKEDFRDRQHYTNMQNCLEGLLLDTVLPIVNENDVVATTELMFTDNDELAGLVSEQLKVDHLALLTNTNGILDEEGNTISEVDSFNVKKVMSGITPDKSTGGRGGMISKFDVAQKLVDKGISVSIVDGRRESVLLDIVEEKKIGTMFSASAL